jgi:plasmid stability protein
MPNLSIKEVPEDWAEALRQRAARHHRSLQGELMAILEQAVRGAEGAASPSGLDGVTGFDRRGWPIVRQGNKPLAQVIDELHSVQPKPVTRQLSSIDLIRADRDAR